MIGRFSIKLGRLFGIEVALDVTWFLIAMILVFNLSQVLGAAGDYTTAARIVWSAILVVMLFASVLAHEFGHALTARAFGIGTRRIVLHLFGGVALIESEPDRPRDEFWITAAGPAVSFLLAFAFAGLWLAATTTGAATMVLEVLGYLAIMNGFLAVFNCLPGFPMDGGRVVRSAIWAATGDFLLSTRIAAWGGVVVGLSLSMLGFLMLMNGAGGLLMILLGIFLVYLARSSARQAEFAAVFRGRTVRDFMRPVVAVVPADATLGEVAEAYFRRFDGAHFPVVDGDQLLGRITDEDLRRFEPRQWDWVAAREAMRPYDPASLLSPGMPALKALQHIAGTGARCEAVFEGRRLLGFVFATDLMRQLPAGPR